MHGRGKYIYPAVGLSNLTGRCANIAGGSYEGEFRAGAPHGHAVEIDAYGDSYEGGFQNGKRHGKGKLTDATGAIYEGEFRDGKPLKQG